MKAVLIRKYGGAEVLEVTDVAAPTARAGEVVVQVVATTVNPIDWQVRDGAATSYVKVTFPVILGCELAGVVAEVGPGVTRLKVGDEVFAMMPTHWGANAERVALAEHFVVKKPAGLSMVEASSLPVAAMTSLAGLRKRGKVQPGERVLVNGASGSVGLAAVQIAKALGAHVTAVCGGDSFGLVKGLGADELIDYKKTDFAKTRATYDVVFDCIGNHPYAESKHVLRGRRVHVTTMPRVSVFLRQFLNGILGPQVFGLITTGSSEDLSFVRELVETGKLKPVVDKVYSFTEIVAAQEFSKSGRAKGKIVLDMRK